MQFHYNLILIIDQG